MAADSTADRFSPTLADLPTKIDALDFTPYVETLADVLGARGTETPLTIGVFGDWGSGKTSLLKMVQGNLEKQQEDPDRLRKVRTVWFDAWKYDRQETLWRAFLARVLGTLQEAIKAGAIGAAEKDKDLARLGDLETALYETVDREEVGRVRVDGGKLLSGAVKGAVEVGLSFIPSAGLLKKLADGLGDSATTAAADDLLASIRRERTQIHVRQVQFLEEFQATFADLVATYVAGRGEGEGRLVVFVDDLDRCSPDKAIELLEAIKLFLDVKGCAFVLALAPDVISRGIELKYRELGAGEEGEANRRLRIDGQRYLEKIIQIPFQIPPIIAADMAGFVGNLDVTWPDEACAAVFAIGLAGSPRQVKRAVNVFLLLWRLAKKRKEKLGEGIKPIRLAKVVVIQQAAHDLYAALRDEPRLLRDLERYYRDEASRAGRALGAVEKGGEGERPKPPAGLGRLVESRAARAVLTMHRPEMKNAGFAELKPDEIGVYFTLTRSAQAPTESAAGSRELFEPELVTVPAGTLLMGSTEEQIQEEIERASAAGVKGEELKGVKAWFRHEVPQHPVPLPEFRIGKYPITNREYQVFVREVGPAPPRDWSGAEFPEGKGGHPVVGVSWHDALTYCTWLAKKTGRDYRLPSEAEWEMAARGTDGRIWPWGNEWDTARANSAEGGPFATTPVGQYSPDGDSPCGSADMAGNVVEWTRSRFGKYPYDGSDGREDPGGRLLRVLRGGAYLNAPGDVRCAARFGFAPGGRYHFVGFRVVLSPFRSGL